MPAPAIMVERWDQRVAILKAVFLISLIFLVTVLIVQLVRMSPCPDSHVSKGQPNWEKQDTVAHLGGQRVERDVMSSEAMPDSSSNPTSGLRKHRKHRQRKSRDKKRKPRSRRSNTGVRGQVREMRQMVRINSRQISVLNRTLLANLGNLRNLVSNLTSGDRVGVHLDYTLASHNSLVYQGEFFVWTLSASSPGFHFFHYQRAPSQEPGKDIYGVQIRFPGQYLLYSQILVNGRSTIQYLPHDCAHETGLYRHNAFRRLLLKSYITQNDLGLPIGSDSSGNEGDPASRPMDSSFQMGIFYLHEHDEIRIRIPASCTHFFYHGVPHGSYFGLMRL